MTLSGMSHCSLLACLVQVPEVPDSFEEKGLLQFLMAENHDHNILPAKKPALSNVYGWYLASGLFLL